MNKPTAATPKQPAPTPYPDVLGYLSGGLRLAVDVLQAAVAMRPETISAGRMIDAVLLLQNTTASDIEVLVRVVPPQQDLEGKPGRFSQPAAKPTRIGLQGGTVGLVSLPFLVTHQAQPGAGYKVGIELQVERKERNPILHRDANGGRPMLEAEIPAEKAALYSATKLMTFSAEFAAKTGNKATLISTFTVEKPTVAGLPTESKPSFSPLWLVADLKDAATLAALAAKANQPPKKATPAALLLPHFNRTNTFFPLLVATQRRFDAAGYRLWAGEAVLIAKLIAHVLEMGSPADFGSGAASEPLWFAHLGEIGKAAPDLLVAEKISTLVLDYLYDIALYDAATYGFALLKSAANEDFGSAEEIDEFVTGLLNSLNQAPNAPSIDLSRAYLPLVLAGLTLNSRLVMPDEDAAETRALFGRGLGKRAAERDENTDFIFTLANTLL
jgi:hypothetical protein